MLNKTTISNKDDKNVKEKYILQYTVLIIHLIVLLNAINAKMTNDVILNLTYNVCTC